MDVNSIYQSIVSFWDSISPVLFAHLIAFFAVRWVAGVRLHTLSKVESYLNSDSYKRWKGVLDEFDLRPKLPYLFLILILVYLTLFNSLILDSLDFPPIRITYSESEFWEESRPLDKILDVGTYGKNPNIRLWEILSLKENYLQEFRTRYPEQYKSLVAWLDESYGRWFSYYQCSILFLVFVLSFAIFYFRKKENRNWASFRRICALLIFSALAIAFTRYEAEKYIEKRLDAELSFVALELHVDQQAQQNRLDDGGVARLRDTLCGELGTTDLRMKLSGRRAERDFWWSRTLERFSLINRAFPSISDEEFRRRYGCGGAQGQESGAR